MFQDVFIIGATGNVGKTLIKQIIDKEDCNLRLHRNPTRIIGVASSKNLIYSPLGIDPEIAQDFAERKIIGYSYNDLSELLITVENDYKSTARKKQLIFVDLTATKEEMANFHLKVIDNTPYNIVTANKNPLVLVNFEAFQRIISQPNRYAYRCSMMAGAENVDKLRNLRDVRDKVRKLEGCFSGTLGYTSTELENRPFSEIIAEAQKNGDTEPHPRDDLSGLDVERKMIIAIRSAGYNILPESIKRSPFIPEKYLETDDVRKFLEQLHELDEPFRQQVASAKERGNVLKYIASFSSADMSLEIGLKEVSARSALGSLRGKTNRIEVYTDTYDKIPWALEGPGSGLNLTAQNIREDLNRFIHDRVVLFEKQ